MVHACSETPILLPASTMDSSASLEKSKLDIEPDTFVTRSVVRPGLKREFTFALKSQVELGVASSPGRTRRTAATNRAPAVPTTCHPPRQQQTHEDAAMQKETLALPTFVPSYESPRQNTAETVDGSVGVDERVNMPLENESDGREKMKEMKKSEGSNVKPALFRTSVVELLRTGLLDGHNIKCIVPGVDMGINSYQFEEHSNIMEGHPAKFIFFENGKTCLDIMRSFTIASVHKFGSLIPEVVGPRPKMMHTCRICGEEVDAIRMDNHTIVCDSCLGASHETSTSSTSDESSCSTSSQYSTFKKTSLMKRATAGKSTKRNIGLHWILFENTDLLKNVEDKNVAYIIGGKTLLKGELRNSGIYCFCCKEVISPSQFEDHAGHSQRRKPYHHIYLPDGLSLHDLSVILLGKFNLESRNVNEDVSRTCKEELLEDVASTSVK